MRLNGPHQQHYQRHRQNQERLSLERASIGHLIGPRAPRYRASRRLVRRHPWRRPLVHLRLETRVSVLMAN